MNRLLKANFFAMILVLAVAGVARADTLNGVITDYESGNQGTNMTVKTIDGKNHVLWFDNMKKPLFEGKALPWCPDFPCAGWPKQLVLGKTHVTVYAVNETVDGHVIQTPTKITLSH
jgi:hypothetical protein